MLTATQSANITAATGSIPATAASFVLSAFAHVLPYILLVVGLFTAYKMIKRFINERNGDKQFDAWGKSDFDPKKMPEMSEDGSFSEPKLEGVNKEVYGGDQPEHWTESAGGIEEHMTSEGASTFYDRK